MANNNTPRSLSSAHGIAWNLGDLYSGINDPKIDADLDDAETRANEFANLHKGCLRLLRASAFADAISEFERICELADTPVIFASLLHAAKSDDPKRGKLLAHVTERNSVIRNTLIFFELEWTALEEEQARKLMQAPTTHKYAHFLQKERRFKPHKLSEAEEKLLEQKSNTGSRAFSRLFDEVTGRLICEVSIDGQTRRLNESEALALLYDPQRKTRRAAAEAITVTLNEQSHLLTYVMNTLVQDHKIDGQLRSYSSPMASRNLANEIDQRSVDSLIQSCVSAYPTVHRFYELKKRLLGYDKLYDYDRYAPISEDSPECDWDRCKLIVRDAYASFAPEAAEIVDKFFEGNWIDAELRPGKRGGAFSASGPTHAHPYILANYTDRLRDVMTIAHELGHGIHQYLARDVGYLQQDTPLTTAEMASVFGEMIVFHRLLDREADPKVRLALLISKIEDAFATVFRQIVLCQFEQLVHEHRRKTGELETQQINELWMQANRPMHGNTVTLTDNYAIWWSYIPHFIHVPFYTYAYAFGELLVLALYKMYQEEGQAFVPTYLGMLAKGGTASPSQLVSPFGLEIDDPNFWSRGLLLLDDMVTQAVELARLVSPVQR